jgi:TonB family protein
VQRAQRGPPSNSPSAGKSAPELQPQLPPALAEERSKPDKLEGQVVSTGQPQDERPPDKPTKYLSERDSRVLKETRARETSPFFKNALSKAQREGKNEEQKPKQQAAAPSAVQSGQNGGVRPQRGGLAKAELPKRERVDGLHLQKAPDGRVPDRDAREGVDGAGEKLAMIDPNRQQQGQPQHGPEGIPGLQRGAPGKRGPLTLTLDRPGEALGRVAGGPMSDDLRGLEEGDETLLNSRSFRFAGFFNRVKETVARIWEPDVLDQSSKRDPSGAIYGWRDRRTLIEYTIDRQGEVKDVKVMVSSGVDYLDRVAVDAFRRAERFPNPPPGLFGPEGTARFGFGFAVTMSRGFHIRMGPAYLPGSPAERGF